MIVCSHVINSDLVTVVHTSSIQNQGLAGVVQLLSLIKIAKFYNYLKSRSLNENQCIITVFNVEKLQLHNTDLSVDMIFQTAVRYTSFWRRHSIRYSADMSELLMPLSETTEELVSFILKRIDLINPSSIFLLGAIYHWVNFTMCSHYIVFTLRLSVWGGHAWGFFK